MPVALGVVAVFFVAAATDFSGPWELQTMGADRELIVEQRGQELTIHRVMWPEFEGRRYKLEHLYRGKLEDRKITGNLLVREQGQKKYELLRKFEGEVDDEDGLSIDGIKLKRVVPEEPAAKSPSEDETLLASILGEPDADNPLVAAAAEPSAPATLVAEGDGLYKARKYGEALRKFVAAAKLIGGGDAALLYRIGRCQLSLKKYAEAREVLGRALRLDPQNKQLKADYETAKRRSS